jgi:hypothetical protein
MGLWCLGGPKKGKNTLHKMAGPNPRRQSGWKASGRCSRCFFRTVESQVTENQKQNLAVLRTNLAIWGVFLLVLVRHIVALELVCGTDFPPPDLVSAGKLGKRCRKSWVCGVWAAPRTAI